MILKKLKPTLTFMLHCAICLLLAACVMPSPGTVPERLPLVVTNHLDGRTATATEVAGRAGRVLVRSAEGEVQYERQLPNAILALCWTSRGELLAIAYRLQSYTFGGNLSQILYRLTADDTEAIMLADVTLRPGTAARFAEDYVPLLQAAFAPMGDELVFVRLHDPPALPGFLQLVHRNWQAERERELVRLPVAAVQLAWGPGDDLTVTTNDGVQTLALWQEPLMLRAMAENPERLDDRPVAYDEKRWTLRRWRYLGLITPEDYLQQMQKETE